MGEHLLGPFECCSEERTEPFSQSEIDVRVKRSIRVEEPIDSTEASPVPLDSLRVEDHHHKSGIRILVRPLTPTRSVSPGGDNCRWLALRAEVAAQDEPHHKVLAVTQTSKDIKFSVRIPGESLDDEQHLPPLWCELYYDPASDNQILLNRADVPIRLIRVSQPAPYNATSGPAYNPDVNPGTTRALHPGTWRISIQNMPVLDFRILKKPPATLLPRQSSESDDSASVLSIDLVNSSGKRSLGDEDLQRDDKKPRTTNIKSNNEGGVIMFLRPAADPLTFPLPTAGQGTTLTTSNGHALLDVQKDETVQIPGGCELDEYQLTKRDQIASTSLSSVFTAQKSDVPDVVTVKVLKTRVQNPHAKPQDSERNVIRQADMWLREYHSQDNLQHESIVKLYGGDARYLSLYMEHVEARDLSARNVWRTTSDCFMGSKPDAVRILGDIASALDYIHGRSLVHNDIKPANILYSPERGAVLCDFGLSTHTNTLPTTGGTPYYVPPEFIGRKLRGIESDVWALGITMLYVLRKIPFPDARARPAHPRPLYWMIADINRTVPSRGHVPGSRVQPMSAVAQMQQWLEEINDVKEKLDRRDKMERLVADMLIPNPNQRVTMAKVVQELRAERRPTSG